MKNFSGKGLGLFVIIFALSSFLGLVLPAKALLFMFTLFMVYVGFIITKKF